MNKRQLSEELNKLLQLSEEPIDFTALRIRDLERLLAALENKPSSSRVPSRAPPLKISIETERPQPLINALRERPLLKRILER